MQSGASNRTVASTRMNDESSRSHAILQITVAGPVRSCPRGGGGWLEHHPLRDAELRGFPTELA